VLASEEPRLEAADRPDRAGAAGVRELAVAILAAPQLALGVVARLRRVGDRALELGAGLPDRGAEGGVPRIGRQHRLE
jgi:hypothetical protein